MAIFTLLLLGILAFRFRLLDRTVLSKTDANLDIFTSRVLAEIEQLNIILDATKQTLNEKHIAIAKSVAYILDNVPQEKQTPEELQRLAGPLDIIELNVANSDGIITISSVPSLIGFDYKAFESTRIYMALADGALTEISEEPRRSVVAGNKYGDINHYTGIARRSGGFVQIGFNAGVIGRLQDEINISQIIKETRLGNNGYGLVLQTGIISAHPNEALLGTDTTNEDWYTAIKSGNGFAWVDIDGVKYYAGYKNSNGYTVAALVPESDLHREMRTFLIRAVALLVLAVGIMILLIYLSRFLLRKEKSKILIPVLFIFSFVVVLAVSLWANSLISASMRTMEYNIEHRLTTASQWLASLADVDELENYRVVEDMELPAYHALREKLLDFSKDAELLYAFYFRPVGDGFSFQYIVDNDFNEETRVGLDTPPFPLDDAPWLRGALEGRIICSGLGNYTTGWDGVLSAYAPVFDRNGKVVAIAGVDIEDKDIVWRWRMVDVLNVVQLIAVAAIFKSSFIGLIFFRRHAEIAEVAAQTAGEANAAKSRFLSQVSHEIRTPLNAVIGLSEIELRGKLPDSSKDNIKQIHQSGSYLLGVISDILDISKIETGKFDLVPVEYETPSFINDTVNLNRVRIGSKPIKFVLEIGGNFPAKLVGDELRVKQILSNLLSNAIKYTHAGTVVLSINSEQLTMNRREEDKPRSFTEECTKFHGEKTLIRFVVRDTGVGIRREDMDKLFTSYTQLDAEANRKIEGTGLGLTIAKNLVEMMGGSITVQSEYGKGSCFTAQIVQGVAGNEPIGEAVAESLRNFNYADKKTGTDIVYSWMPGAKALVVDDIPANLLVAKGLLKPYGLQVDTADCGQAAIEKIKRVVDSGENYDIVFMDHMMGGLDEMDGIEALAAIRKIESCENTPVVALTANALRGMREFYLEQGFADYLSKPIDPRELDDVLNRWIEKKKKEERKEKKDEEAEKENISSLLPFNFSLDKQRHQQMALEIQRKAVLRNAQTVKDEKVNEILRWIKDALQHGDEKKAGRIVKELFAENENPKKRELYFTLYDLLVENKTEKALERIEEWLKY